MHIFHKWTKWNEHQEKGTLQYTSMINLNQNTVQYLETRQKRTCLICGFVQDVLVKDGPMKQD